MCPSLPTTEHSGSSCSRAGRLIDNHGRLVNYLRLSVTDRCNLRCRYCMPTEGIRLSRRSDLLTWEEMHRLCRLLCDLGVTKIRITGGEPFVRKQLLPFLAGLKQITRQPTVAITTNGTALEPHLEKLKSLGIQRLNISLDSLDPATYRTISRHDHFARVWQALHLAAELDFRLKINMVVLPGWNDFEIPAFVELTRDNDWTVRFIEPMPFNGQSESSTETISGEEILQHIQRCFPIHRVTNDRTAVDELYRVEGARGKIGIIRGYHRSFCDSCSRLRISAQGQLRTCLYGPPQLDLQALLRDGATDIQIARAVYETVQRRHANGLEAERECCRSGVQSMVAIGG